MQGANRARLAGEGHRAQMDPRAVENPLSAIFDLSEDVVQQAPAIWRAVRYATVFMSVWLAINVVFIVIFLFDKSLLLFILCAVLFVIGFAALVMLRRSSRFFKYYVMRHSAIKAVRDADPLVYAPSGTTPAERLVSHLRASMPRLNAPDVEFAVPGIVEGTLGMKYKFDAYLHAPSGAPWRLMGLGNPGLSVFVKAFDARPRPEDVLSFRKAVEDVSARTGIQPARAIVLWLNGGGEVLDDETYNALLKAQVRFSHGFAFSMCAVEMISEYPSGEYDFVPYMAQASSQTGGRRNL
ncbi:MAG: hypothetical protein HZB92_01405 [Euryarchaeota archaeon]|nr:hypothetical protein [Euryarchaeota archaeon]